MQTRASEALAAKFKPKRSGAQKRCHEATKIPQSRLSRLAGGTTEPTAAEAVALERSEGIPVSWWAEPAIEPHAATGTDGAGVR